MINLDFLDIVSAQAPNMLNNGAEEEQNTWQISVADYQV
jgi:hypothetical protein